jgi:glucose/arabinose dehydrogenase
MSGDRADSRSRRDLLTIPQPFANHNGGQLQLGPDGFLYVGMGDGGGAGDPEGNGQNPATLLGTILRIDPQASTPDRGYAIPAGNPYILGGGAPEVWITGARNPWRFSFDRLTGDLWVADVGQDELEELNLLPADASGMNAGRGANLGWPAMEGDQPFSSGEPPPGAVAPILTYGRDSGACSVIGGYVYRGTAIPALQGAYLYGDFCTGEVRALLAIGGIVVDDRPLGITVPDLASFGQTSGGELMTMSKGGEIRLITPA